MGVDNHLFGDRQKGLTLALGSPLRGLGKETFSLNRIALFARVGTPNLAVRLERRAREPVQIVGPRL